MHKSSSNAYTPQSPNIFFSLAHSTCFYHMADTYSDQYRNKFQKGKLYKYH